VFIREQAETMSVQQREATNNTDDQALVFVEYVTDPLCSWSWAFEAQWRRLLYECAGSLDWRYRMGGLLADWRNYDDPLNDIHSPAQMGPQWFQVHELTGMPLDDRLWRIDPPASSYPACIAMKAAERQGRTAADRYLRRLREAAMIECRNIGRRDLLLAIAQETAADSLFDLNRFSNDLGASETVEMFRQDLRDAAYYNIGRFPTLICHRGDGRGIVLVGYRPYDALQAALEHLVPGIVRRPDLPPEDLVLDYITHWRRTTACEVAEVLGCHTDHASAIPQSLVAAGLVMLADDSQSEIPIYVPASTQHLSRHSPPAP
jgi:putative protein-disulfide isomerase